jgi:protein-disulfide isomerase
MRAVVVVVITLGLVGSVAAADGPVATVGGRSISRAELEAHVKSKLIEIDNERYDALKEGLDEMVGDELLKQEAAARKLTPEELEKQEVASKVAEPTDAEIQKVYDENKAQLGGQTLDQVKPRIVTFLKQQASSSKREEFIDSLKSKYKTTIALRPPVVDVATAGRPERGGAKAPVTIIEFSDYECPFCKRAESTVEQVMTTYGDKVKLVYRDYPLPFHQHARPAAEAANCANAQGKFWEYHKKLFAAPDLSADKLKSMADETGLDRAKFDDCLSKTEFKAAIDKDIADGSAVGVNGTPAFFINGRMLSGAQPFEKFKEVIDDELQHADGAAQKS